ncbi:hypothetical protein D3C86_2065910 [compost metagenome]
MPVCSVRHDWVVYLQYGNRGVDGADRHCRRPRNGGVTVPVCHDYRHCRFGGLYDAGFFPGEHVGVGAREL